MEVPLEALAVLWAPCMARALSLGGKVYLGPGPPGPGGLGRGLRAAGEDAMVRVEVTVSRRRDGITKRKVFHVKGAVGVEVEAEVKAGEPLSDETKNHCKFECDSQTRFQDPETPENEIHVNLPRRPKCSK